ncbi:hypothetical protein [Rhodohalobacter sp. 8-1]|uniref:hypothetical protein n=1 Tax=Rhodohalobacter sp. 8-1 TaxID=3131972 RepID=UPI0030EE41F5
MAHAQEKSRFGLSFERDQLRNFRIDNRTFNESRSYTIRFSFFENNYTNIEYSLHHTRGYDEFVAYSFGLSAAYVISIADDVVLKPGISFDAFKLKDRKCKSFMKSMFRAVFDVDDNKCDDDQHTSFTPQLTAEISISDPVSIFFRTDYRLMYSIVEYEEVVTEISSSGEPSNVKRYGTDHSFYGAGIGFGAGLKYNF